MQEERHSVVAGGAADGVAALGTELYDFCLNAGCGGEAKADAAFGFVL